MKWFKHYTNAHKGSLLQEIYLKFGVNEGHGLYFRLLEYLGDKWDGCSEPRFKILTSELRQFTKLTTPRFRQLAAAVESCDESVFKISEDFCEIYLPKLLEIKHRDSFPSSQRPAKVQPDGPPRIEEDKEEEVRRAFLEFYKTLPLLTKDPWIQKYGDAFIQEHGPEAYGYVAANAYSRSWSVGTWARKIGESFQRTFEHKAKQAAGNLKVVTDADVQCGIADV